MAKKKSKHKHSRSARKSAVRPKPNTSGSLTSTDEPRIGAPTALGDSSALAQTTSVASPVAGQPKPGILDSSNRWFYVRGDLRRISLLASLCIGLELLLWYVLTNTSFGDSLYDLIKI